MLELKPSLAMYPQAIKAIMMASCHRKGKDPVTGTQTETMQQGLTNKQGAGIIDPMIALSIVGQGQYGVGTFSSNEENIRFVQPAYGANAVNVSVAWTRNVTATAPYSSEGTVHEGTLQDIDVYLYRDDKQIAASTKSNSSSEMVYANLSGSGKYKIKLSKYKTGSDTIPYGYAWSTNADKESYQVPAMEDIYYIRNKMSNYYLEINKVNGTIYVQQNNFSGNNNQM